MRAVSLILGLVGVATYLAAPGHAQEQRVSGPYVLSWDIASHEVPSEPFWVKEQGEVVSTRLLPRELLAPVSDVMDEKGKLQVPAGHHMVAVSAPYALVCNVNSAASGQAKSKRVCLLDTDRDGLFETAFSTGKGGRYWMTLEDDLEDEKQYAVTPVAMQALDPATMEGAPSISFHYQRILDGGLTLPLTQEGGDVVRFHFKVGEEREGKREWMVKECRDPEGPSQCASANFPSVLQIAGLKLNLLERRKEDVLVQIVEPFGGQPVRFTEIHDGYNSGLLHYAN